jgi:hypothetical protein
MWQQIIAGVLVIAAAVYVARMLGPRSWRRKKRGTTAKAPGSAACGCGKDKDGCH